MITLQLSKDELKDIEDAIHYAKQYFLMQENELKDDFREGRITRQTKYFILSELEGRSKRIKALQINEVKRG